MFETRAPLRLASLALLTCSALALAACGSTGANNAPTTAVQADPGRESLSSLERAYKKNPDDVSVAVRYARALREDDRLSRASIIIAPFAKNDRKPSAAAKTEYAAIQAGLGNYKEARDFSTKAIALDKNAYQAYHIQGIALDATGDHAKAEDAFRKALELWQGDKTPVLNNLGLNLASQGFLDEASEVLRQALAESPNRGEIERNLRIVDALRESGGRAPSYLQKERDKKNAASSAKAAQEAALKAAREQDEPAEKPKAKAE